MRICIGAALFIVILLGSVIPFANASAPAQTIVGTVVPIQVPVLTKSVTLNGAVYGDEWSDAPETTLTLQCTSGCGQAPVSTLNLAVRLKHDDTWLYFLVQTHWSSALSNLNDVSPDFEYYWSANGYSPYFYANYLWPWGIGSGASEAYRDPTTQKLVRDHGATQYHVVEAAGAAVGDSLTYEFRALLKSGYPDHWSLTVGGTYGVSGVDGLMFMEFCAGPGSFSSGCPWDYYRSVTLTLLTFPMAIPSTTSTSSASSSSSNASRSTTVVGQPALLAQVPFGMYGLIGGLVAIVMVASIAVVARKRKTTSATAIMEPQVKSGMTKDIVRPKPSSEPSISTGHKALDGMLAGGLPEGHAVLIVSQSYDERDLLIRKMIEASLTAGRSTFYLSNDTARTRDFTTRFGQNFYAMNPLADRIASGHGNLFKIPDVGDLSGLSITSNEIIESKIKNEPGKLIVIDLLSDLLLRNKALTTRKWLSDFVSKRKANGFTVLATLDPSIAPKEDVQTIIGVFDGVIEIYERALQERSRRFLIVKKMYGRDYSESELMLDRQQLL
ncbi:MAG: ATPase domain-containing protein [Candidatus Bathyarchaeia archaeon]